MGEGAKPARRGRIAAAGLAAFLVLASLGCAARTRSRPGDTWRPQTAREAMHDVEAAARAVRTYRASAMLVVNFADRDAGTLLLNGYTVAFERRSRAFALGSESLFALAADAVALRYRTEALPGHYLRRKAPRRWRFGSVRRMAEDLQSAQHLTLPVLPIDLALLLDGDADALVDDPRVRFLPEADPDYRLLVEAYQEEGGIRRPATQPASAPAKPAPVLLELVSGDTRMLLAVDPILRLPNVAIVYADSRWLNFPAGTRLQVLWKAGRLRVNRTLPPEALAFVETADGEPLTPVESEDEFRDLLARAAAKRKAGE